MQPVSPELSASVAVIAALISAVSTLVAVASLYIARKNWRDSNRPVVSAYVDEESGAQGVTIFNLYVKNSGTRPATLIELSAEKPEIAKIIADGANTKRREDIESIFSKESRLAILHPEESVVTSFGVATTEPREQWLNYGEELPARVRYCDLEGRKYQSLVLLKVRPSRLLKYRAASRFLALRRPSFR